MHDFDKLINEIKKIEKPQEKIKLIAMELFEKLLPKDEISNTEIKAKERSLLSILELLKNPFGNNINYENKLLKDFLRTWYLLGLAIDRKGRIESVEAIKGIFKAESVEEIEEKKESKII